jgi:hypothetical protein
MVDFTNIRNDKSSVAIINAVINGRESILQQSNLALVEQAETA